MSHFADTVYVIHAPDGLREDYEIQEMTYSALLNEYAAASGLNARYLVRGRELVGPSGAEVFEAEADEEWLRIIDSHLEAELDRRNAHTPDFYWDRAKAEAAVRDAREGDAERAGDHR